MERSLRRQTRELGALLEAGRAMAASIDYDEVLRRVARAAGEALGTAECVIWEYSPDTGQAMFRCLWERDPVPGVAESLVGEVYPVRTHAGGMDALRAGVVLQQSRSDPDLPPEDADDMDRWGEKTWLNVPLVMDAQLLGVMILIESRRERRFDADEVRMAGVIGEQAAMAMRNALRHRREEERNRWLGSLVSAGRAVSAAQDPDDALGEVARLAAEALQSPAAFIYEYAPDRDVLVTRARWASADVPRGRRGGAGVPGHGHAAGPPGAGGRGGLRRERLGPGAVPGGAGADAGLRRADPAQRAAPVARRGARHAGARRGRRRAGVHGRRAGLHARVRRAGHSGAQHGPVGDDRRPDRAGQPPRLLRTAGAGAGARPQVRRAGVAAHDRHRRLQGAQRHLRPPRRGRSAATAGPTARRAAPARHRPPGPLRRRGVRRHPAQHRRRERAAGGRRARPHGAAAARPSRGTAKGRRRSPSACAA